MHSIGKPKRTAVQLSRSCYLCCCRRVPSCCGLVIVCSRDPTRRGRLPSPRLWGSSSVSRLLTCTDRQRPCHHQQKWPWLYFPVESDIVGAWHGLASHTHTRMHLTHNRHNWTQPAYLQQGHNCRCARAENRCGKKDR